MDPEFFLEKTTSNFMRFIQEGNDAITEAKSGNLCGLSVSKLFANKDEIIETIEIANKILLEPKENDKTTEYNLKTLFLEYKTKIQMLLELSPSENLLYQTAKKIESIFSEFSTQSLEENSKKEIFSLVSSPSTEFPVNFFEKNINSSVKLRENKLKILEKLSVDSLVLKDIKQLEVDLNNLKPFCEEFQQSYKMYSENSENEEVIKNYLSVRTKLTEMCDSIIIKYKDFEIDKHTFDFVYTQEFNMEGFIIQKELILNQNVNKILSLREIGEFTSLNKMQILDSFAKEGVFPPWKETINEKDIRVEVKSLSKGTEGHNGGKQVAQVSFYLKDQDIPFKFVFKPRNALIDKAVIDTFKKINNKSEQSQTPLPTYAIINPEMSKGWKDIHEIGEISLWEFIEGEMILNISKMNSVNAYVKSIRKMAEKSLLESELNRMDAFLTPMLISDLHTGNILIREREIPRLIPIDMEVVERNGTSRLGTRVKNFQLTQEEKQCIEDFNSQRKNQPFRIIPLGTQELAGYISSCACNYKEINNIVNNLSTIIQQEYELLISKDLFQEIFFRDVLNGDVPFFTEFKDQLYYGLKSNGTLIGKRKEIK